MIVLHKSLSQRYRYGPSDGVIVYELENEDEDAVCEFIERMTKGPRFALDVQYSNPRRVKEYDRFTGDLLIFDLYQDYTD